MVAVLPSQSDLPLEKVDNYRMSQVLIEGVHENDHSSSIVGAGSSVRLPLEL